ncbi:unnamed protein product [Linum trigynum]|uniref:Secreted protein n=1 Tax=Linum trigynum TaxID=586398 RepID=A0AAV2E794_9ROSI
MRPSLVRQSERSFHCLAVVVRSLCEQSPRQQHQKKDSALDANKQTCCILPTAVNVHSQHHLSQSPKEAACK